MKEILFRGKRIDNGEWVEGYLIACASKAFIVDASDKTSLRSATTGREDKYDWRSIRDDPATIGQYTGLVDKNGKKIFEGDIVKQRNEIGTIYYERNYCTFAIVLKRNADLFQHIKYKCEIIGNIHDNPELLR